MIVRRSKRGRGFTIIEILIAIVVLVLGITGILALFPTAIDSGNKTVEDSYSAAITQSVVDAIAVGLRESRYTWAAPGGQLWTYFIFDHDGVIDKAPGSPEDYEGTTSGSNDDLWLRDYCIVLPRAMLASEPPGGNTERKDEPVFIYPVPNTNPTGTGEPGTQEDQRIPANLALPETKVADNFEPTIYMTNTTTEDTPALWVSRVYQLGRYRDITDPPLPAGMQPGDIRLEYRGEDLVDPTITVTDPKMIALDPYPTYGFCFAIKRARVDTTGGPSGEPDGMVSPGNKPPLPSTNPDPDAFSSSLYELRIMIFKNFNNEAAKTLVPTGPTSGPGVVVPKTNVPIKQFITLISI